MKSKLFSLFLISLMGVSLFAQERDKSVWADENFSGLKMRSIGPALMAGRIADIAIHPENDNVWYVAVGSGNVWKTVNAGVTWKPIFDDQGSYSTGCITIDSNNPDVIWLGTGENVGGRHVGYGDGIYRSDDGGGSWTNMGLKDSQHISRIVIHPDNSDILWVAAQGPLWSEGGERGVFKSTNGGTNWKQVLGDKEWTGATEIVIDPRNPDRLYAATWQRHRTIAAYMGGGPGTGLYRSSDGGESWEKLTKGLPTSNMGKIGLAISPQKPDILYAAIELDRRTGAVYRSADRGSTWEKRSDTVSGATGPHYYQELYASPHQFDRLYLMDVRVQISDDGGKTFRRMTEEHKHSDNHAIAFRSDDPDYLLVGTDGGMYESFDLAQNWRFIENLPITQFYKVAVDDAEPFYNIYGGTQDNSTEGGPSRTDNTQGIQNSDWRVVLDWDGHQPATEPGNPDIMYGQRQQGTLARIDLTTGEVVDIVPQPNEGEDAERFNWDAPILVSPHSPTRIYFGSQRLWRSDNRGDSWTAVSGDLTRNEERFALPIMGRTQSWDNPWDLSAMSTYNTITSIAESPVQAGLIMIGTDDGLIQVTENGGKTWRKIEVGSLPGVPKTAYVNDIKADLFDAGKAYIALDNHKYGDFQPYLLKTTNRGKTWRSIGGNIPDRTLVWRIVQDHVKPELLFAGTEFGIYFSTNGGEVWTKLTGGVPVISFRDLAIQRKENDLVGASFGRSFYVLDDYTALREVTKNQMEKEATLFPIRKTWWYIPRPHLSFYAGKGSQGAGHFVAPNPPFGAVFTYYLKEDLKTLKDIRKEKERELNEKKKDMPFPGWDAIEAERRQETPKIWISVEDGHGNVVRRVPGPAKKGFHRVAWDLRYPAADAIDLDSANDEPGSGFLAPPGTYSATLYKQVDGQVSQLAESQQFEVVHLREGALPGSPPDVTAAFWRDYENATRTASALRLTLRNALTKVEAMKLALATSTAEAGVLDERLHDLRTELLDLDERLSGNRSKQQPGEKTRPTIGYRLFAVARGVGQSTYGPTETNKRSLEIAVDQLTDAQTKLELAKAKMSALAQDLLNAGAPWIEGEALPER
jgi:hypothetical protein